MYRSGLTPTTFPSTKSLDELSRVRPKIPSEHGNQIISQPGKQKKILKYERNHTMLGTEIHVQVMNRI